MVHIVLLVVVLEAVAAAEEGNLVAVADTLGTVDTEIVEDTAVGHHMEGIQKLEEHYQVHSCCLRTAHQDCQVVDKDRLGYNCSWVGFEEEDIRQECLAA